MLDKEKQSTVKCIAVPVYGFNIIDDEQWNNLVKKQKEKKIEKNLKNN